MKTLRKLSALLIALATLFGAATTLISCGNNGPVVDNESTRLVLSTRSLTEYSTPSIHPPHPTDPWSV